LFFYSEQFDNAAWNKQGSAISANQAISPDGTTNADLLYPTANGSVAAANQSKTISANTDYTQSVYVKAAGKNFAALYSLNGGNGTTMWVNLTTGAITNGVSASNRFATSVGNGWWRIGFTEQIATTLGYLHVYPTDAAGSAAVTANGTDGIYIYGAQIEAGAYATSYVKTEAAAVTRLADFAKKENIGGTLPTVYPFTLYSESDFYLGSDDFGLSMIDITTTNNYFTFGTFNNKYIGVVRSSSGEIVATSTVNYTLGFNKVALVVTSNSIKVFANGALVATATNTLAFNAGVNDLIVGTLREAADLGTRNSLKQALVFKSALTDAQCVELTTP
jgi:hypothetical protein